MAIVYLFLGILSMTFTDATESTNCFRRNSYNLREEYCCDDHERRHGVCIKCEIGTTSTGGKGCVPCPNMTFGKRCSSKCICNPMEICDKKRGCIDKNITRTWIVTTTKNSSRFRNSTTELSILTSIDTSQNFDEKRIADTSNQPSRQTTNNCKHSGSNQHIVVYIVCAVVLFLLLIMCAVGIQKKETLINIISRNAKKTNNTDKGISITFKHGEHLENCVSAYDIIDEQYAFSKVLQNINV